MKDLGTLPLETSRLFLRRFVPSDKESLYRNWAGIREVSRFITVKPHSSPDETARILEYWIDEYGDGSYRWAICEKQSGALVGTIAAMSVSHRHESAEIGYVVAPAFAGKGYATEALEGVLTFLLSACEFRLVEATCVSENAAGIRVLEKSRMTRDALLTGRWLDREEGRAMDLAVYSASR